MGLKLSELNFQSNLFHLGVDGFIVDPKVERLTNVDLGRLKRSNVDHERFRPTTVTSYTKVKKWPSVYTVALLMTCFTKVLKEDTSTQSQ